MKLKISSLPSYDSIVDGPGLRMVIWTQGCPHNCKGCHNPKTHSFDKGIEIDTKDVINELKTLKLQRGITLSGGEPFLQPEALSKIAKEARRNNLDVWSYTGYTIEELCDKSNPLYLKRLELLKNIDVLVDGKFIEAKKDISLLFRGSSNQRIIDVKKTIESKRVELYKEYMKIEEIEMV